MEREIDETLIQNLEDFNYTLTETSYLGLRPGDIVQLTYEGSLRYGLVVSSRRTSDGMFLSSRNNTLLNFVQADTLSEAMFSLMINNLYNNETACNYNSREIIGSFLGRRNFRTFNVAKIRNILKVNVDK
tara:strand:- start:1526 stop:1915 length:390 start_codon:yes stop_codon:yes gene_type:complete